MKWGFATTNKIKDLHPSFIAGGSGLIGGQRFAFAHPTLLNRLVRTRLLGDMGAGEGDFPGYPTRPPSCAYGLLVGASGLAPKLGAPH